MSASMGPPIYIGGNSPLPHLEDIVEVRFNGATDLHRWKPIRWWLERVCPTMASMGPPIYIGGNPMTWRWSGSVLRKLQWGHRFTSVETLMDVDAILERASASMGPPIYIGGNSPRERRRCGRDNGLQWGHRFTSVETGSAGFVRPDSWDCFNGATDLHRWKQRSRGIGLIGGNSFNGATDLHRWKR